MTEFMKTEYDHNEKMVKDYFKMEKLTKDIKMTLQNFDEATK